jgi:uncharacterized protein YjbI with pentapeptide repeats
LGIAGIFIAKTEQYGGNTVMSRDALVVGLNTYQDPTLPNLQAPALDGEAIAQTLAHHGEFRVKRLPEALTEGNVPIVGKSLGLTTSTLESALIQLFKPEGAQIPELALFYFSGHGLRDQGIGLHGGYLATTSTQASTQDLGLSLGWLRLLLEQSPVKQQVIWLDCCHSGSLFVALDRANPGAGGQGKDRCFIASSRDFESSWQDLQSPYSVFTKALLDGLDPERARGVGVDSIALTDFINKALKGELQTPIATNSGEPIKLTWSRQEAPISPTQQTQEVPGLGIRPYKGLAYFDCNGEDPKYFYGREELTKQLLDQVRTSAFTTIVGASGSGKSSVLRAGLLHQLQLGQRILGSDQWRVQIMLPGEKPLQNLALTFVEPGLNDLDKAEQLGRAEGLLKQGAEGLRRLVQTSGAERFVLVIDQFEEVFTLCGDEKEREAFLACVLGALAETAALRVVLTMRADFVGKCLEREYSGLAKRVQENLIPVLPLSREELEWAICRPAERVGLGVEPLLVQQILDDIAGAPGELPLLQYTLTEIWRLRQVNQEANQLSLGVYQALGGIRGTLDKRATAIYREFSEAEQGTVRHIFLGLTQLGEGTEDTRRRVLQEALVTPQHPQAVVQWVVQRLADAKLVVTSEVQGSGGRMAVVDVAHEALIRHWGLLRRWLAENRGLLLQQRRIENGAMEWRQQGEAKGYLLQGIPLREAKRFQREQVEEFPLSVVANRFIQASVKQRRWSRIKVASWLIIPALILFIPVDMYFLNQRADDLFQQIARGDDVSEQDAAKSRYAVEKLSSSCIKGLTWLPLYPRERLLGYCRLSGADLSSAYLPSVNLSFADLRDTNFRDANLRNAEFPSAYLSSAYLNHANLSSADLKYANFSYTDLRSADLNYANLSNTNLSNTDLSNTDLSNADLSNADLSNADLRDADLRNAILLSTNFTQARNLIKERLETEGPPLLCATYLPSNITDIDPHRDCDEVKEELAKRYPWWSKEDTERIVEEAISNFNNP